ncbi:O-antigen ligase family protein [Rhizobium sp. S163]|uniref:O-antigen ligase family protein n=1 Tax=Rhizobium sp. S163 TaxID=3055039 RepID=UPI0025A98592|nr:O-antigen ligase family protein [Rhizobium sp. S163]MDM9645461.1 O-antigen ligase family protein [Rhizobium sp. S163]
MSPTLRIFGGLLWVLASSALLVESDTYRYACAILAIIALVYYVREPLRPRTNWLGWLCMGWALYVLARFAFIYLTTEHHDMGGSDWLFAFPLFFPILGVAFALYEGEMERIIAAFFVVAVAMLAVTVALTIGTITTGVAVRPLVMNNQIHGAVACGLIFVMSTFWLLHYLTTPNADRRFARLAYVVSPLVLVLCVIAIYGAKSKGVWLAMAFTLPVLAIVGMRYIKVRARGGLVMACAIALLGVGIYAVRHNLDQTAGPTIKATTLLFSGVLGSSNHAETITQTIQSDTTPVAMDERLQLWSNGWELFSSAPIFGWGNEWLERWQHTRYAHVSYTLLHNGYLEILVRFGLFGAVVMALILASFIVSVCKACRQGIIPRAAMHAYLVCIFFFALTLLSNSNNRLAIGESLALVTSAFACWCNLRLRPAQENLAGLQAAAG